MTESPGDSRVDELLNLTDHEVEKSLAKRAYPYVEHVISHLHTRGDLEGFAYGPSDHEALVRFQQFVRALYELRHRAETVTLTREA